LFIFKFSENGCPVFSTLSSDSDGIKANTYYQYLTNIGRQVITSAPYRYSTDSTLEWTCTQYDVLSRVTAVASFNGSVPTTLPSVGCDSIPNHTGMTIHGHPLSGKTRGHPYSIFQIPRRWLSIISPIKPKTNQVVFFPLAAKIVGS
jgi:hypothetical protein